MGIDRRQFLRGSVLLTAAVSTGCATVESTGGKARNASAIGRNQRMDMDPFLGTQGAPFTSGIPCLQAPGETTIGVSWRISGLAKGVVEVADNAEFHNSWFVKSGGYGLVPIDVDVLQVRLEGLKPGTRYWYRTITTPFIDYRNIYDAKLGKPVVSEVHSFMTLGKRVAAHFCVINDTHAQWKPFEMAVAKVKALAPTVVVWNGDATNTTQDKDTDLRGSGTGEYVRVNMSLVVGCRTESGGNEGWF